MTLANYVEAGALGVLLVTLITIIVLAIGRNSAFNFALESLKSYQCLTELELVLNKNMTILHSIVSNAVYIGLFGTTLGVMITLGTLGENAEDTGAIISSLTLPLVATAASLVVAIFGTFVFNALEAKIEEIEKKWEITHGYSKKSTIKDL